LLACEAERLITRGMLESDPKLAACSNQIGSIGEKCDHYYSKKDQYKATHHQDKSFGEWVYPCSQLSDHSQPFAQTGGTLHP
jgi:hypothetical protein